MDPARLIFAVAVFAPLLCAQSAGSISGLITNSITGARIEGVKVRAARFGGGSTPCGTVRGVVEKGAEKGGGSIVVLMAEPTAYARFGLTAHCDPDGNFSIPDVPPGNYTAVAFQDFQALYHSDNVALIDSAHGERVKIEAGASETVALKVN